MSIDVEKSLQKRGYCGLETPDELYEKGVLSPYCVHVAGHVTKHRDPYGVEWATPSQQSGDDRWNARDEQLRELLSYCRGQVNASGTIDPSYEDVVDRLTEILDGEK